MEDEKYYGNNVIVNPNYDKGLTGAFDALAVLLEKEDNKDDDK